MTTETRRRGMMSTRAMPIVPMKVARKRASPMCLRTPSMSFLPYAPATKGVMTLGRKPRTQKVVEYTWFAAPWPASAAAFPIFPTQNVSAAPTRGTSMKLRIAGIDRTITILSSFAVLSLALLKELARLPGGDQLERVVRWSPAGRPMALRLAAFRMIAGELIRKHRAVDSHARMRIEYLSGSATQQILLVPAALCPMAVKKL
eukprot:752429-Hanusia_phi.AAC.5